ncbi:hypothetical protein A0256_09785 [Mucilaginibacter sp. PAMC 26640]|nr:hypothetical protein A0256_09785 [Mucilaginibacter sp. PAMC 26640]
MIAVKIEAGFLKTISWLGDKIIDWACGGVLYDCRGKVKESVYYNLPFNFNAAITSADGTYAFVYSKLGTKGVLLKNGKELREINRPYYCANAFEYPAAFTTLDDVTYLIHCPLRYDRLDFENVETGKIVTNKKGRKNSDTFHSRLETSPDGNLLICRGWVWHPRDVVEIYDIRDCLLKPAHLDRKTLYPDIGVEICTASFINDSLILIGSTDEVYDDEQSCDFSKKLAIWDVKSDTIISHTNVNAEFGNLFVIDDTYAWDLFIYPKIVNFKTGEIVDEDRTIDSGRQNSSIIGDGTPQIIYNRQTKQIAIARNESIVILTPGII